jgi:hypothetical protein
MKTLLNNRSGSLVYLAFEVSASRHSARPFILKAMTPTQKSAMLNFHQRVIKAAIACGNDKLADDAQKQYDKLLKR